MLSYIGPQVTQALRHHCYFYGLPPSGAEQQNAVEVTEQQPQTPQVGGGGMDICVKTPQVGFDYCIWGPGQSST